MQTLGTWLGRQYEDIKGHAKWAILGILWTPMAAAAKFLLQQIPHFPSWAAWLIIGVFSAIAFILVARSQPRMHGQTASQVLATHPGIPTQPSPNFNFDDFFRLSYTSQLTDQTERDIKVLVAQQYHSDREDALAKFIGIGFWGYMHEITWAYIFRSQVLALTELNARGGLLPIADIRAHVERAKTDYPQTYASYSFEQWMIFMTSHNLCIRHPTEMIEITIRGRDFLKFLTHWGWNADMRQN